jgi:hypothetical protein
MRSTRKVQLQVEELESLCLPSTALPVISNGATTPALYDGNQQTIHLKQEPAQAQTTLLAHNKSINIIYGSINPTTGQPFEPVINALPAPGEGPGFNPIWQEVDIVFSNPNFAPQQFTSDNDILAAAAAGEITLVPTTIVFECAVVSQKVIG